MGGEVSLRGRARGGEVERERERGTHQTAREDALQVPGTIAEDDKGHAALLAQAVDPAKDADPLAALLDGLADLDLGRVLLGLVDDDGLGLLELLELSGAARLALDLLALAALLVLGELVAVLLEELGRLLLGGRGRGGVRALRLALGRSLADVDVDRVARARDEGADDRLERLALRAVARLVVAGRLVDVHSICCE